MTVRFATLCILSLLPGLTSCGDKAGASAVDAAQQAPAAPGKAPGPQQAGAPSLAPWPAETVRVPEDYDTVDRALFAVAPGSTIVVAAGEFPTAGYCIVPVTIRGAGAGKTILLGTVPERGVVEYYGNEALTLQDLSIGAHVRPDVNNSKAAVDAPLAHLTLEHVEIGSGWPIAIKMSDGVLRDVNVAGAQTCVLHAEGGVDRKTLIEVDGLASGPVATGQPIQVIAAHLHIAGASFAEPNQNEPIAVLDQESTIDYGPDARGLDAVTIWTSGRPAPAPQPAVDTGAGGASSETAQEDEGNAWNEGAAQEAMQRDQAAHFAQTRKARAEAVRALQAALRHAPDAAKAAEAYNTFLTTLKGTFDEGRYSADDFEAGALLGEELSAYLHNYGPEAFAHAAARWPLLAPNGNGAYHIFLGSDDMAKVGEPIMAQMREALREEIHRLLDPKGLPADPASRRARWLANLQAARDYARDRTLLDAQEYSAGIGEGIATFRARYGDAETVAVIDAVPWVSLEYPQKGLLLAAFDADGRNALVAARKR